MRKLLIWYISKLVKAINPKQSHPSQGWNVGVEVQCDKLVKDKIGNCN